jgi:hypothetical protein
MIPEMFGETSGKGIQTSAILLTCVENLCKHNWKTDLRQCEGLFTNSSNTVCEILMISVRCAMFSRTSDTVYEILMMSVRCAMFSRIVTQCMGS